MAATKILRTSSRPQVHKLKLAKQCVSDLDSGDIATEVGPMALALYKWVLMILDVQGL